MSETPVQGIIVFEMQEHLDYVNIGEVFLNAIMYPCIKSLESPHGWQIPYLPHLLIDCYAKMCLHFHLPTCLLQLGLDHWS